MDRRKFFRSMVQGGIFSALAGTAVYLLAKEKPSNTNDCNFEFVCQNCAKKPHCQLPEASKFRLQQRTNQQLNGRF